MTERPIHLDARDLAGRMGSQGDMARRHQREPTPQDAQRFAQALQGGGTVGAVGASTGAQAGDADVKGPGVRPPSVFSGLFGAPPSGPAAAPASAQQRLDVLRQDLVHMVGRMLVDDGSSSAGGRRLMMDISDELLSGVTVAVFEDAGAWVAEFRCRQEQPFVLLAEPAQQMASRLADALGAEAVWRVVGDGLTPGGTWDRLVNNETDGLPSTEAFASCPHARR